MQIVDRACDAVNLFTLAIASQGTAIDDRGVGFG